MSNRFWLWTAGLLLAAGAVLTGSEDLKPGEAAIFYRNGDMIVDEVLGVSSARNVLELKTVPEISLNNLWMINFINTEWYHLEELELVDTNRHHIFLRDGEVHSGRIVRYDLKQGCFEFASGEKFPIDQVRRIYFTRNIPEKFEREIEKIFLREGRVFRRIKR
jgi:hypothetical protein